MSVSSTWWGGVHYSEEEQVIGTWIDGKPLYQKTVDTDWFTPTNNARHWDDILTIGDGIDTLVGIVSARQDWKNNSGTVVFSNTVQTYYDDQQNIYANFGVAISNGTTKITCMNKGFVTPKYSFRFVATVQYTKTTD